MKNYQIGYEQILQVSNGVTDVHEQSYIKNLDTGEVEYLSSPVGKLCVEGAKKYGQSVLKR